MSGNENILKKVLSTAFVVGVNVTVHDYPIALLLFTQPFHVMCHISHSELHKSCTSTKLRQQFLHVRAYPQVLDVLVVVELWITFVDVV